VFTARLEGEVCTIVSSGLCQTLGRVRTNNEDQSASWKELNLFILSDGDGRRGAREVARAMAVDVINKVANREGRMPARTVRMKPATNQLPNSAPLKSAVAQQISDFQAAQKNHEQRGMGATMTALC